MLRQLTRWLECQNQDSEGYEAHRPDWMGRHPKGKSLKGRGTPAETEKRSGNTTDLNRIWDNSRAMRTEIKKIRSSTNGCGE